MKRRKQQTPMQKHSRMKRRRKRRKRKKEPEPVEKSTKAFCELEDAILKVAKSFSLDWGSDEGHTVVCEYLPDGVNIPDEEDMIELPEFLELLETFLADDGLSLADQFFKYIFPDITGHAKIIDKFFSDERAPFYETVEHKKIKFHDEADVNPDWMVQQCYLLLIAAATETKSGVNNLWKCRPGHHNYADFGQYMPVNYFKAFCAAAAYCWADERYWYEDQQDVPWEVSLPCLNSCNNCQQQLIKSCLLLLDESMSGWRLKMSKLGSLPNYTYEPCKPVPLGTMFQNGAECISGCLVFQDVVQLPEKQCLKDYHGLLLSMPKLEDVSMNTL